MTTHRESSDVKIPAAFERGKMVGHQFAADSGSLVRTGAVFFRISPPQIWHVLYHSVRETLGIERGLGCTALTLVVPLRNTQEPWHAKPRAFVHGLHKGSMSRTSVSASSRVENSDGVRAKVPVFQNLAYCVLPKNPPRMRALPDLHHEDSPHRAGMDKRSTAGIPAFTKAAANPQYTVRRMPKMRCQTRFGTVGEAPWSVPLSVQTCAPKGGPWRHMRVRLQGQQTARGMVGYTVCTDSE